ncbi:hypothetical protein ACOMHN_033653 [Nucella lapillus]
MNDSNDSDIINSDIVYHKLCYNNFKTTENTVIQYMADNVDHDTATLDGRGTFHGMGIIASVTPGVKAARRVPRRDVSLKDIKAIGQIKIHFFR